MTIRECYTVLELEPGASLGKVKKAYKLLAAVWHPDRFANDPNLRSQVEEKLKRLPIAYRRGIERVCVDPGEGARQVIERR